MDPVTDRSAAPSLPGPAEPSETLRFASADGTGLYGEFFAADGKSCALVIHGYAEHCGRYREVAHGLTDLGLATLTFDLRGHGRADGQRGHVGSFDDYLADVDAAFAELERRCPGRPVLLVCHSNGSLIGLRLLADPWRCPKLIRAAVLSSPFLAVKDKVPLPKALAARVLGRVMPSLSLPLDLPVENLTHDPGKLAERRVDTLCHDVASARWYTSALHTQAWVSEFAGRIAVPTLWLIAGGDLVCDPAVSQAIAERVEDAEVHVLAGMHHEVFNEIERAVPFALVGEMVHRAMPR